MIDSHIHLDAAQYADPDQVIKRSRAAGVQAIIVPGVGPSSNLRVMELAGRYPGFVFPAIGFHPERTELSDEDLTDTLAALRAHRDSICALGEVGLPYYGEQAKLAPVQERARVALFRFAQVAVELNLAVILHAPHETARQALEVMRTVGVRRAVFHWHKSEAAATEAILKAGYYVSLTPEVVYRERDQALARMVPLDLIMVETDGPWAYTGPFAGRQTEPPMLEEAIAAIAAIKGERPERVSDATVANARRLFGI